MAIKLVKKEGNINLTAPKITVPPVDLSDYYTKEETDEQIQIAVDGIEIPEQPDLTDYALKTEIPDISGYALKSEIPDVSNFATKDEIPEQPDLTNYALKTEIPDVSNFATKDQIPDVSNFATKDQIPNMSGYYTKAEIDAMIPASGEEVSY